MISLSSSSYPGFQQSRFSWIIRRNSSLMQSCARQRRQLISSPPVRSGSGSRRLRSADCSSAFCILLSAHVLSAHCSRSVGNEQRSEDADSPRRSVAQRQRAVGQHHERQPGNGKAPSTSFVPVILYRAGDLAAQFPHDHTVRSETDFLIGHFWESEDNLSCFTGLV